MVASVDSLRHHDADTRSQAALLLGDQTRRLAQLVEDLMEMSRFDAGVADFQPELLDLRTLVLDAIAVSVPTASI